MSKRLPILLLASCLLSIHSCSEDKPQGASDAAVGYYQALINKDYDTFVDGMQGKKDLPASYRAQFILLAQQFADKQISLHNGVDSISVVNTTLNKQEDMANVFLRLCYADSTSEEVLVPMVKESDIWLMK